MANLDPPPAPSGIHSIPPGPVLSGVPAVQEILPADWPARFQNLLFLSAGIINSLCLSLVVWLLIAFLQDRRERNEGLQEAAIARHQVFEQLKSMNMILHSAILDNRQRIKENTDRVRTIEGVVEETVGPLPEPQPKPATKDKETPP